MTRTIAFALAALFLTACGQLSATDPAVGDNTNSFPGAQATGGAGDGTSISTSSDANTDQPDAGTVVVGFDNTQGATVADQTPTQEPTSDDVSALGMGCTWQPPADRSTMTCGDMAEHDYYGTFTAMRCVGQSCMPISACQNDSDCHNGHRCFPLSVASDQQDGCGECRDVMDCPVLPCKRLLYCARLELRCVYTELACGDTAQ